MCSVRASNRPRYQFHFVTFVRRVAWSPSVQKNIRLIAEVEYIDIMLNGLPLVT